MLIILVKSALASTTGKEEQSIDPELNWFGHYKMSDGKIIVCTPTHLAAIVPVGSDNYQQQGPWANLELNNDPKLSLNINQTPCTFVAILKESGSFLYTQIEVMLSRASFSKTPLPDELTEEQCEWTGVYRLKDLSILAHSPDIITIKKVGNAINIESLPIIRDDFRQFVSIEGNRITTDGKDFNGIVLSNSLTLNVKSTPEAFVEALIHSGLYEETVHEVIPIFS